MSQTTFHEACRFCGCTRHGLSSIGPNVCPRCDVAINIAGTQPPGVTFDQYRDFILEVVAATDLAPRHPGERWSHYRSRAILVLNVRREGKADPGVSAETSFARDAKGDRFRQAAFPRVANCIAATAQTASSSEAGRGAQIADRAKDHAPEAVVTTMTEIECAHPREQLEKIGPRYRCTACRKILRSREVGLNPRALNLDPDLRGLEHVPVMLNHLSGVMAGLVPAIHAFLAERPQQRRGCPRQARA
jgi:hypothetical protein